MIISKTPLRISFAGGGTDFPKFFQKNNYGAVLSTSINKYIYVIVKKHSEFHEEKFRLNYSETEKVNNIEDIKNPLIRKCFEFLCIDDDLYVSTIADAPGFSGLGSSSAFCVGLLNALYTYKGKKIGKPQLAEEAAHIEIDLLKRPMGKQDHFAVVYGGLNYFRFNQDNSTSITPLPDKANDVIFSNLLSFWTGLSRNSEVILKEQDDKTNNNNQTLIELRNQAEELLDIIKSNNISSSKFGELLNIGWNYKKQLSSKISNKFIDDAYNIALNNGALQKIDINYEINGTAINTIDFN